MRLLLDTHIAVWAALDPAALMQTERNIMSDTKDPLVLSAVAVWELIPIVLDADRCPISGSD